MIKIEDLQYVTPNLVEDKQHLFKIKIQYSILSYYDHYEQGATTELAIASLLNIMQFFKTNFKRN